MSCFNFKQVSNEKGGPFSRGRDRERVESMQELSSYYSFSLFSFPKGGQVL